MCSTSFAIAETEPKRTSVVVTTLSSAAGSAGIRRATSESRRGASRRTAIALATVLQRSSSTGAHAGTDGGFAGMAAEDVDLAFRGLGEPGENAEQGGFACTIAA